MCGSRFYAVQYITFADYYKTTMRTCGTRNIFLFVIPLIINIFAIHSRTAYGQTEDAYKYPQVEISQGKLRGINVTTRHERVVHGFMGIPFAQPPIGNLRFRDPLPASAWNGTLNATKDANMCPQVVEGSVIGDEDCLYLNVYTPQLPTTDSRPLPVMVWIHGGKFSSGTGMSADSDPSYIMDRDVILVTPNYRLGLLGFLSTGDEVAPGNYGMKDMVLVLTWVRDNIIHFGGDPNQVTIFGISTGATSVNLLAMSDLANGLFHRYIKLSGSAISPRGYVPRSTLAKRSLKLGEFLDCSLNTSTVLIECLRGFNASYIVDTISVFLEWDMFPDIIWMPTDEPEGESAFLTDSPANLYSKGKFRDLPCISGKVRDEGLHYTKDFYANQSKFDYFLNNIDHLLPYILLYQDSKDASARTAALKTYYLNDLGADRNLLLENLTQLIGDTFYIYPVYSALRKQFSLGHSQQYLYSFEYIGSFQYRFSGSIPNGIPHASDQCFFFPLKESCCIRGLSDCEISESDSKIIDVMTGLWSSFATNGTPTVLTSDSAVTWEPYSTEDNYLMIGNGTGIEIEMKNSFLKDRMRFWDDLTSKKSDSANATYCRWNKLTTSQTVL